MYGDLLSLENLYSKIYVFELQRPMQLIQCNYTSPYKHLSIVDINFLLKYKYQTTQLPHS